jgi:membrane protease YdiL (CAAX protease family)
VVWVANVLMLVAIWAGLRVRGQSWADLGLSLRGGGLRAAGRTIVQAALVLILAMTAFVAGGMLMQSFASAGAAADTSGYDYLRGNLPRLLMALAAVYVVSSFGEEVLYRGFLINRMEAVIGKGRVATGAAITASAVIFGLAHFNWGVVGIVQTFFMGLVLALAYVITSRNLWALVLAHALMDTLLLVQVYAGPASP